MSGRKAQVALFVLVGFIVLVSVILTIYLVSREKVSMSAGRTQEELYANNPELAAEAGRMQERVDNCLKMSAESIVAEIKEYGLDVDSIPEAETIIEQEISLVFPDCFFEYNTDEKLTITDPEPPRVDVSLGSTSFVVGVEFSTQGIFEDQTYSLSEYHAKFITDLEDFLETTFETKEEVENIISGEEMDSIISKDNGIDLYALSDQNKYIDLLVNPDGTCTFFVDDYTAVLAGKADNPIRVSYTPEEPCIAKLDKLEPEDKVVLLNHIEVSCADDAETCAIPFSAELGDDFMISSALDVDMLSWTFDPRLYPPGQYLIFAEKEGEDEITLQGVVVTITEVTS